MAEHIINLNSSQEVALEEMNVINLEEYIQNICNSHIEKQLDNTWKNKTLSEKQDLLS